MTPPSIFGWIQQLRSCSPASFPAFSHAVAAAAAAATAAAGVSAITQAGSKPRPVLG